MVKKYLILNINYIMYKHIYNKVSKKLNPTKWMTNINHYKNTLSKTRCFNPVVYQNTFTFVLILSSIIYIHS